MRFNITSVFLLALLKVRNAVGFQSNAQQCFRRSTLACHHHYNLQLSSPSFHAAGVKGRARTTLHVLKAASSDTTEQSSTTEISNKVDYDALVKYVSAIAVQMSLFFGVFSGVDYAVSKFSLKQLPFAVTTALFYILSLRSRIFNPLSNNRPQVKTLEAGSDNAPKRIMPKWTPPGLIFPIMWILIIGPLRAVSSSMVYSSTQRLAHPAIMAFMLHLSIGDTWNTINNVERRYGTSVVGVIGVWLSKAFAAYQYYQVVPRAGKLLALPLIWLTIATSLITATWRLNPNPQTGKPEPLYPTVGKAKTKFVWFR